MRVFLALAVIAPAALSHTFVDIAPRAVVGCDEVKGMSRSPSSGTRVVLGRIALPPRRLPGSPNYAPTANKPLPYFAKWGVEVRSGRTPVDLVVPRRWRGRLALGWGDRGPQQASVVHLLGCRPVLGRQWLGYAGGFFLRAPACVAVDVRVGDKRRRIPLGIGVDCGRA